MKRAQFHFVFGSCILAILTTGCLLNHSNHMVIRQGEPLAPIGFESEFSKKSFESYVKSKLTDDANKSSSSFGIPFLVGFEKSKTMSESAIRNDALARFDTDKNGVINDYEVIESN
jgi:hypothetical protein